jgi:hypothetical protein
MIDCPQYDERQHRKELTMLFEKELAQPCLALSIHLLGNANTALYGTLPFMPG